MSGKPRRGREAVVSLSSGLQHLSSHPLPIQSFICLVNASSPLVCGITSDHNVVNTFLKSWPCAEAWAVWSGWVQIHPWCGLAWGTSGSSWTHKLRVKENWAEPQETTLGHKNAVRVGKTKPSQVTWASSLQSDRLM